MRRGSGNWLPTALVGIGVATVAIDARGRIVSMNVVAESLTGWTLSEATGQPVATVFRIENESTRLPVMDPATEVLVSGTATALADHTVLIARSGEELRIDQGADVIRDASGAIIGALLIFCDVSERHRAVQGLEDVRRFTEEIVQAVCEPLVVLDAELRVRTANRAYYQMFGVNAPETEGLSLFELGNRQWDIPRLRQVLEEVLPRDSSFRDFAVEYNFESIGYRSMILNARRIPADSRRPSLILLAIEDATERLRAVNALGLSEARYRRLFETAQDGILLVDPGSRQVFDANPFLTDILGYSHDELVGKELWEIGLFRDIASSKEAFQILREKGYIRYDDLPLQTKDGQHIEVEFVSNVYNVGGERVIQCNIRDITDRKRAESALQVVHAELESRVEERTAELARANETLIAEIARRERAEADRRDLQGRLATAQEDE